MFFLFFAYSLHRFLRKANALMLMQKITIQVRENKQQNPYKFE